MLIIETIILCSVFWGICYINTGNEEKNIKCYSSYPDEIQHMLKNNSKLSSKIKTSSPLLSFVSNILIYGVVLFLFGLMIRKDGFISNFINMLILGQILNAFDFLSLIWYGGEILNELDFQKLRMIQFYIIVQKNTLFRF